MARGNDQVILGEIREIHAEVRNIATRIDALHGRIDTVIDSLADLRRDFGAHTHEN